ncbi:hypothetical protein [Virgibacillus sp. Bac330]|uniref:hypothetical protein n=1 Tax=Virgibacillus sp. Bac330 TaxID=2419841 RepID=UPI000EF4A800|nr:hypothetical protein [Virgibacillus sp. Bac330]
MKKYILIIFFPILFFCFLLDLGTISAQSTPEIILKNVEGELLKNKSNKNNEKVLMKNLSIHQNKGKVTSNGTFDLNGKKFSVAMSGDLYPVSSDSPYSKKVILGDMKSTNENYNILQFKIEKEQQGIKEEIGNYVKLSLILEEKGSGNIIHINSDISKGFFENAFKGSHNLIKRKKLSEDEVIEKTIYLLNINNKSDKIKLLPKEIKVEESGIANTNGKEHVNSQPITNSFEDIPLNTSELNRLLSDLKKSNNNVNLSDYDLPESLFKGSDWKKYTNFGSDVGWNYYAKSAQQLDKTLTQITMFQQENGFQGWYNEEKNNFEIAFTNKHGMIIEYDHHTKDINVIYYGWGLSLQDLQIAQGKLKDKNVYIAQTLNGLNLSKSSNNLIGYFVGLVPYGDKVVDLWKTLKRSKSDKLGNREKFIGSTYEEQIKMHDGKVYRASAGSLEKRHFEDEEAHVNLVSEIHSPSGYINLTWSFKTNVAANL